ncbi:MAG TPA: 6-bladed beta-propeller, partial [Gemmatimonadetes bacterium]|nr:6-bladed beta-propeller [Gemmatimonadota bacterium]
MKKLATTLVALMAAAVSASAQYAPQIPTESVPDFFRLPNGVNFGEVPAVAVNSQG